MRSAFEVQLQMLQKQAKDDPNAEREVVLEIGPKLRNLGRGLNLF